MKTKKNITIIAFLIAGIASLLYILLAAIPLTKEYNYVPEWNLNLTSPTEQNLSKDTKLIDFKLGQTAGYFTEDGQIAFLKTFPQKASISENYFSTYTTQTQQTDFYSPNGTLCGTINEAGFPYFCEDRIYLMQPCGTTYSKCNSKGEIEWTNQSVIPITAFSSNKIFTIGGYADGTINIINNADGQNVLTFNPGGSDFNVIFGVDISPDGKYIASISGHDKQRFIITQRNEDQSQILYHKYLDKELNRRTVVKFSKDGSKIFYNYEGGLGIFDMDLMKDIQFPLEDKIIDIQESTNLLFILGQNKNKYTVYAIERTNVLQGKFSFTADSSFIKVFNDVLYVGKDTTISKISIVRK